MRAARGRRGAPGRHAGVALLWIAALACSAELRQGAHDGAADRAVHDGAPASEGSLADRGAAGEQGVAPADRGGTLDIGPADAPLSPDAASFPEVSGKATFYAADGSGNCMFPPAPGDLMVAAMNELQYDGSRACGACVSVTGPKATIVVRIVDRCPECQEGHIDLSAEAFAKIADPAQGVVPITWSYVACAVSGPIRYQFKDGSSQWWTAIQVRNARYAVDKLEVEQNGAFAALPREMYNYFVSSGGLGPGPYTIRVTDVLGHVIEDAGIPLKVDQEVAGQAQFPL